MYGCYMMLFCLLFYNKYVVGSAAAAAANGGSRGVAADKSDTLCGVDLGTSKVDMAGRFADFSRRPTGATQQNAAEGAPNMRTRSGGIANGHKCHNE